MKCIVCGDRVSLEHNRAIVLLDGARADVHWWCLAELVGDDAAERIKDRISAPAHLRGVR
jgi:hypothetical protein